jgi:hypothetical protein
VIDEHQNQPLAYHLFGPELALTSFPSFAMLFEGKKYRNVVVCPSYLLMRAGKGE